MVVDATEAAPVVSQVAASAQTVLAIGRSFADAPGALPFIEEFRITNPTTDVRVLTDDRTGVPELLKARVTVPGHLALRSASYPLARQTRRASRHAVAAGTTALVNGATVRVINVSALGVQVVSPEVLRPGQRAQLTLGAASKAVRIEALVAWSTLEMEQPARTLSFRAGLAFPNAVPEVAGGARGLIIGR
jgi:hypothetical protein